MENNITLKYHKPYADEGLSPSPETSKVIEWVGKGKKVLEFGCHTGHLASWLIKNECQITGVEINEEALQKAKPFLLNSICADLDSPNVWEHLKGSRFDVISFLHILEHLKTPEIILNKSVEFLNEDGIIIIGLPNISNAKERMDFLRGKFEYTEMNVMDKTHLRFFNQDTARRLIHNAKLEIIDYYSPWQLNPLFYFFNNTPFFWRFSKWINKSKPAKIFNFSNNLTDVAMLFLCKKSHNYLVNL